MTTVLVTPIAFGKNDPELLPDLKSSVDKVILNPVDRPLQAHELFELVKDIDGYIAGIDTINASVLECMTRCKVISRFGVGVDRVAVETATKKGIVVTNTPGANSVAVAELTLALMLGIARNLCVADQIVRRGDWRMLSGISIKGKTVGLVGIGAVGREVAKRLGSFDCKVIATDPNVDQNDVSPLNVEIVEIEELLEISDFVSLHLTLNASTKNLVDERFLSKMKNGAFLINTARGELVDERALLRVLKDGHLRGAAMDCFIQEPVDPENELMALSQVIVTPHTAAHTDEAITAMGRMSLNACLSVLAGERPQHIVNPEVYEQI
jgi:D-3-phosphoglycerate dehydrogenase